MRISGFFKKLLIIGGGIICLFIFFDNIVPGFLSFVTSDTEIPFDQDLLIFEVDIRQENNSYYDLAQIRDTTDISDSEKEAMINHISGKEWDEEFVSNLITRHKETFDLLERAVLKIKFQIPALANPDFFPLKHGGLDDVIFDFRNILFRLSIIRAEHFFRTGKNIEALEEIFRILAIAHRIQLSQIDSLGYVVVGSVKLGALDWIIKNSDVFDGLSKESILLYVKQLKKYDSEKEAGLQNVIQYTYNYGVRVVDVASTGGNIEDDYFVLFQNLKNSFHFRPNQTKGLLAKWAREAILEIKKPCGMRKDLVASTNAENLVTKGIRMYFTENSLGRELFESAVVGLDVTSQSNCNENSKLSEVILLLERSLK